LKEFEELLREFQWLGLEPQVIGTRRDIGITRLFMARLEEGEAELLQAYEVRQQSADSQFRTGLWLVSASLQRGNVEQARRWLARTRVIARKHPEEIARLMAVQYIAKDVTRLECEVATPRYPRKG
jgi:hypothetical protein